MRSVPTSDEAVTVVVATKDRCAELLANLPRLLAVDGVARVIVVDNGSSDGTAAAVRAAQPEVTTVRLPANIGCGARTVGARLATTPYVAFADDDSWWRPDALRLAVAALRADPRLALVTGAVRVEPGGGLDAVSVAQAAGRADTSWRPTATGRRAVRGFLACAAVVDRTRYLAAGGFEAALGIGGEEELLALDLAGTGWHLGYAPEAEARHAPSAARDPRARAGRQARNDVVTALVRLPAREAVGRAARLARGVVRGEVPVQAVAATAALVPWALAGRRRAPATTLRDLAAV